MGWGEMGWAERDWCGFFTSFFGFGGGGDAFVVLRWTSHVCWERLLGVSRSVAGGVYCMVVYFVPG